MPTQTSLMEAPLGRGQYAEMSTFGTVLIRIMVDTDGHPNDLRIVRPAGLGLDEKAAEAVKTWTFDPAIGKDGNPVPVFATVEVSFRLY